LITYGEKDLHVWLFLAILDFPQIPKYSAICAYIYRFWTINIRDWSTILMTYSCIENL
jgi:hypothetical protein